MANKFFDLKNIAITVKGIVNGLIVGFLLFLSSLVMARFPVFGLILMLVLIVLHFFAWGFFANKLWGWK